MQLRKADERWAEAEKEKRRREAAALAEEEKRAAEVRPAWQSHAACVSPLTLRRSPTFALAAQKAEREAARKAEEEGVQACGDDSADQNSLKKLSRQV